jgi:hypothetical protein
MKFLTISLIIFSLVGCTTQNPSTAGKRYDKKDLKEHRIKREKKRAEIKKIRVGSAIISNFNLTKQNSSSNNKYTISFDYEIKNFIERDDFYYCSIGQNVFSGSLILAYEYKAIPCSIDTPTGKVEFLWEPLRENETKNGTVIVNPPYEIVVVIGHKGNKKYPEIALTGYGREEIY